MSSRCFRLGVWVLMAFLCCSGAAWADKIVVLEFEGDEGSRVQNQVLQAVRAADEVKVVSLSKYKEAARRKKVSPDRWMSAASVSKVAPMLGLSAVIWGTVGERFEIRILDSRGEELWAKDLPLVRGALSKKHAVKLARAIAAAAQTGAASASAGTTDAPEEEATDSRRESQESDESKSLDSSAGSRSESREQEITPPEEEVRDADLGNENRPKRAAPSPSIFSLAVNGSTTWRHYCARPGVKKCQDYENLSLSSRPRGDTVDFSARTPYAGFSLSGTLLPMAQANHLARGLGVSAAYAQGFSQTNVKVISTQGDGPGTNVVSTEQHISLAAFYRFYFPIGVGASANLAYVGVKGGYDIRRFTVDPKSNTPLPSSSRNFPLAGLEVSIPLAKVFRLEGAGYYLFSPKPAESEVRRYGDVKGPSGGVDSNGWGYEAGISGDIWGPIGYAARFRVQSFSDVFNGAGEAWPCSTDQCGGAASESYMAVQAGLTASF